MDNAASDCHPRIWKIWPTARTTLCWAPVVECANVPPENCPWSWPRRRHQNKVIFRRRRRPGGELPQARMMSCFIFDVCVCGYVWVCVTSFFFLLAVPSWQHISHWYILPCFRLLGCGMRLLFLSLCCLCIWCHHTQTRRHCF
jgi:hypothetical protein